MATTVKTTSFSPASFVTVLGPHPDSHGQVVKLSAIDQIAPRDYMSICLCFRLSSHTARMDIYQVMQEALMRTINDIPEIMCCVQKHTGNSREEVELLFDSTMGVEIHYRDYTSPELCDSWNCGTFQQLEQEHFPLSKMPRHLIVGACVDLEGDTKIPSLIIQANFIPGGLILGSRLHHVVGDGQCNFMLWSAIGAHFAAIADGQVNRPTRSLHFLDRTLAVRGDQTARLEELPHWKLVEDPTQFLNPTLHQGNQEFEYATFFITAEKLAQLKLRISANMPSTHKPSTVEALSALFWRHVVVARDLDPRTYPEVQLSIAVDARGRMEDPVIPMTYWGNFAEPNAVAQMPMAFLRKGSPEPSAIYAEMVHRIRRAIAAVNDTAVRRLVGLLNQMPKTTAVTWNVDRYPGPDMLMICLLSHRFNDIYFGRQLQYPSAYRTTVGNTEGHPDGRCFILPPRRIDNGGLEIAVQYTAETLDKLEHDKEFAEYIIRRN